MAVDYNKTPWPWFGGKADAAPAVWQALGDVDHYVEPFAGSLAVLLRRPHPCNRTYFSETVNDIDGLLVNAWRSMQLSPDAMAAHASWPVSEADLHARHLALLRWREEHQLEHLMGDHAWHDPVMAGWWAWGQSCWIGSGWCSGKGGWTVGADGRITRAAEAPGVSRQLPHLGNDGQGTNRPQLREAGVSRQLPHLGNDGQGTNTAAVRETGVAVDDDAADALDFHAMTMPELRAWFRYLSARIRHVRILNGDWARACTSGASKTLPVRQGGVVGFFLDPPYSAAAGRADVYSHEDLEVAHAAREWALVRGQEPDTRIVLAGYEGEGHEALAAAGWRSVEWFKAGFLRGGMGNTSKTGTHQQKRERLWMSPHCIGAAPDAQGDLFA